MTELAILHPGLVSFQKKTGHGIVGDAKPCSAFPGNALEKASFCRMSKKGPLPDSAAALSTPYTGPVRH